MYYPQAKRTLNVLQLCVTAVRKVVLELEANEPQYLHGLSWKRTTDKVVGGVFTGGGGEEGLLRNTKDG